jgi:hypothetical protein
MLSTDSILQATGNGEFVRTLYMLEAALPKSLYNLLQNYQ